MTVRKKKQESAGLIPVQRVRDLAPVEEMERWFERWFEEPFRTPFSFLRRPLSPARFFTEETAPMVDIFEEGEDLVVKAELPGLEREDINVTLADDVLTISGEKKREEKVEEKNYYRLERSSGSFSRSFRLPVEVQADKVKATFKGGVLEMRMPKTEEAKEKEIKIKIS